MKTHAFSILEPAHEKSYAQTTSVRKITNDKAREDRAIAREYKKQTTKRRKSWLRSIVKLHKEQAKVESNKEDHIGVDNILSTGTLSPLKPQRLNFGSTSGRSPI